MMAEEGFVKGDRTKKVAVIAVHGISDQKPYESARAIADLLLTQADPAQSTYAPFSEQFIRVKVARVEAQQQVNIEMVEGWNHPISKFLDGVLPRKWAEVFYRLWDSADERGPFMRRLLTGKPADRKDPLTQPDYLFIRDQIDEYQKKSVYDSICLEGYRIDAHQTSPEKSPTQVHIYEMYWADLSRLGSGFVRIFGELYQLLFHLGSLGRQSVDLLRAEHQEVQKHPAFGNWLNIWAWYGATEALAARILSLFLPILNLCLLVVALLSLPGNIPEPYAGSVATVSTGILLTVCVGHRLLHSNKTAFWPWLLLPFFSGIAAALSIEGLVTGKFDTGFAFGSYRWLAIEWAVLLGAVIWYALVKPYSRHRPGADVFAIAIGIPLGLATFGLICTAANSHLGITFASLRAIEVIYLLLMGGWMVFLLLYFSTLAIAGLAIASIAQNGDSARTLARRAAWTARFALAFPALLFSFLTLSLWTALARLSKSFVPDEAFYKPLWFFRAIQPVFKPFDFAHDLTVFSGSGLASIVILATVLALILFLWVLVPAILTEIFPPETKDPDNLFSQGLGNWLNNGFRLILGPGDWIISWVIPFLFFAGTIDGIFLLSGQKTSVLVMLLPWLKPIAGSTETLLTWVAAFLTASATSLIAFGGRLNQLSLGLRGAIDAVLDVDNYLRLHPRDDNPSARIYARYTSLLRYLCRQTAPDGEPYDALIVVAHSQGSVISADLLRFLAIDPDPELKRLSESKRIYLFTMGSPLRQLYSYAFPHLYRWAIQEPASAETILDLGPQVNPRPETLLGVRAWVNSFRSGDYVGRHIWRSDRAAQQWFRVDARNTPNFISVDRTQTRREFCLGPGAHTHYWDKYAPEVAREIDRLIRES
ncbi:hypothetical protein [Altericista sp. CCNU0014]|uniref:hypothetical protein n=1 Tax=Altericista sp. CCNU0014 TaxID=3082949 RepID=UPI00384CABA8